MKNTVIRYTVLNLDLNYAYEIETDKMYKVGQKINIYDAIDRKTYTIRVVRLEGTVYNKSSKEIENERKEAIA